ncbi:MAG TPA: hypothetical protein DEB06_00355 [Phycisphaerales bacterium]|nr:hypothetical protein [Phycisphaerales bacterium]
MIPTAVLSLLLLIAAAVFAWLWWRARESNADLAATHARELARRDREHAAALRERTGAEPMYIADHYMRAALLAYYAPGRPSACSAVSLLGGRRSSYDFFPDTDLRGPALLGRPAVLVGAAPERWDRALSFDEVFPLSIRQGRTPAMAAGLNYRGPRSEPAPPVPAEPRP